jgi:hypothetical protein
MNTKLIVGNKYVPHQKTVQNWSGLSSCSEWQKAKKAKQPFLYYTGIHSGDHCFSFDPYNGRSAEGNYYNEQDVTPYNDTVSTVKLRKGNVVSAINLTVTSVCGRSFNFNVGRKIKSVKGETFQLEGDHDLWFYLKDFRRADTRGFVTTEKLVNNKTNTNTVMTKYTVTRKQLSEIHPQVCSKWQGIIEETIKSDIFADSYEVAHPAVSKAFAEADSSQAKMLSKYFPTFKRFSAIQDAVNAIGKTVYNYPVVVDEEKSRVFVPLPNANREWSLEAFDYVIAFIKAYPQSYPVHNVDKDKAPSVLAGGNSCLVIQFDI